MKPRDLFEFLLLAALWGGSFLFMRVLSPEFGVFAGMSLRTLFAAALLLPVMLYLGLAAKLKQHFWKVLGIGVLNSGMPFALFAFATLWLPAGFTSILNSTAPFWGALIGFLWLRDRLSRAQVLGLFIGFCGVVLLVWDKLRFDVSGTGLAVLACLLATFCYGLTANFTKRYFQGVDPVVSATGSQLGAGLVLLPFALFNLPTQTPSSKAWLALLALAFACTALAYLLYFRLMKHVGPSKAIAVTFMIPVFGMLWGWLFLNEVISLRMILATGIILIGTSLTVGLFKPFSGQDVAPTLR